MNPNRKPWVDLLIFILEWIGITAALLLVLHLLGIIILI